MGKCVLIMPMAAKNALALSQPYAQVTFSEAIYRDLFPKDLITVTSLNKIFFFWEKARLLPAVPMLKYQKIKNTLTALNKRSRRALIHLDLRDEERQFVYVLDKVIFDWDSTGKPLGAPCNFPELHRLKNHLSLQKDETNNYKEINLEKLKTKKWALLNCFNSQIISEVLGKNLENIVAIGGLPTLTPAALKRLGELAILHYNTPNWTHSPNPDKKIETQVTAWIEKEHRKILLFQGPPGAGKTHTARNELKNIYLINEEENFNAENREQPQQSDKKRLDLRDEYNTKKPGSLNHYKNLSYNKARFFALDKNNFVAPRPKPDALIGTANDVHETPDTFKEEFANDHGWTLRVKQKQDDNFNENKILKPILEKYSVAAACYPALLNVYKLIPQYVVGDVSLRQLKLLASSFLMLWQQTDLNKEKNIAFLVFQAAEMTFAGSIKKITERKRFIQALQQTLSLPSNETILDDSSPSQQELFTASQKKALAQCQLLMQLRQHEQTIPEKLDFIRHILFEGKAGIGKKYAVLAFLKKEGFTEHNTDVNKRFYVLDATAYDIIPQMIEAAQTACPTVLKNFHLADTKLLNVMKQLLTGVDLQGRPLAKKGWVLFSTCSQEITIPPPILNRSKLFYMDAPSYLEFKAINKNNNNPEDIDNFITEAKQRITTKEWDWHDVWDNAAKRNSNSASHSN